MSTILFNVTKNIKQKDPNTTSPVEGETDKPKEVSIIFDGNLSNFFSNALQEKLKRESDEVADKIQQEQTTYGVETQQVDTVSELYRTMVLEKAQEHNPIVYVFSSENTLLDEKDEEELADKEVLLPGIEDKYIVMNYSENKRSVGMEKLDSIYDRYQGKGFKMYLNRDNAINDLFRIIQKS